VAFEVKYQGQT